MRQVIAIPRAAPSGDILVSWATLDVREEEIATAAALLSPDEIERSARFVFPLDRARWIASRALLRRVLGGELGADPGELRFSRGPAGKPRLNHPACALEFNLSHSGDCAAVAVTSGVEVGIDVEVVRPVADLDAVAARFFSASELEHLRSLPHAERLRGFFECWTRKEAFLKATGDGLSRPLDSFSVTLGPNVQPRLRHTSPDAEERDRWSLFAFEPRPDVLAALAVPRGDWRIRCSEASARRA